MGWTELKKRVSVAFPPNNNLGPSYVHALKDCFLGRMGNGILATLSFTGIIFVNC